MLDTTVLLYAVGIEHPLRDPCRALVGAVGDGALAATTTVEVLQEFTHVRSRRWGRADGAALARSYAALLTPLVALDGGDLLAGLDLFGRHRKLGAFDAILAAAATNRGADLVSADRGFAAVDGLTVHDPAAPDFLDRITPGGRGRASGSRDG